ncbi:MAG: hypothetical protein ACO3T7_13520, partial [Pseudomonadales bacterium]
RLTVLDTYSGSGTLVSESQDPTATQTYSFQNLQASNEVDVLVFTLDPGGHIQVDADLDFINVSQTLDWRQGSIDIAPDADLTIRGGTVVFGSASLVTGYGELALGASNTSTQTLDTVTLAIDGELNSNQFQGEVSFRGAVTLTTYGTTSQVATLIISSGDEIMLDGSDQLDIKLVNEGELTIQGEANEITQTLVNAAEGEIDLVLDASGYDFSSTTTRTTSVDLQGTLINQGSMAITTYQAPPTSSTTTASLMIKVGQTSTTLAAIENSGDWVIAEDFGANEEAFWFGNDALVSIEINADVTNTGYLQIVDGQVVITGSLVNSGVIEVAAPRTDAGEEGSVLPGLTNPRGGTLSIMGDLVLSPNSVLSLTVGASASILEVRGLDVSGQITTDATSNPTQDLGRLELDFFGAVNDAEVSPSALESLGSLHDRWQNQDPLVLFLGNQFQPGSALTDLASNLPEGYELTLVTSSSQTNTQTISVEINNGFESILDGNPSSRPSSADDVLILADLSIAGGETLEVKSFSLEGSNTTTSATVTLTIFAGGHLITNGQSAIFHGQRLILDADTSAGGHLTLGGDLTVAGEMTLSALSAIDGSGTVNVTPSGTVVIGGGSVDTAIVTEGRLTLSGTAAGSSGSLHNLGWTTWSTATSGASVVHIDVINDGVLQLDPTAGASNSFVLRGVTLAGDGILGLGAVQGYSSTSSFVTEVDINLNNAVLNASEMDLVLFSPLTSTTTVTLSGSGTDPSVLVLSDGSAFQSIEVDGMFSSSGASVLRIAGDWRVNLEGMVQFQFDASSYVLPVLDASQASSLVLQTSSGSTAELVNQGVLIANGLIVESGVVLANVGDEWGASSFGQLALSGSSRIDGDFYNLDNAELSIAGNATFAGSVITDFSSRIQLGSALTMLDTATYMSASAPSNTDGLVQSTASSASVTFAQDLTLQG